MNQAIKKVKDRIRESMKTDKPKIWNLELNDQDRHTLMNLSKKVDNDTQFSEVEKELLTDFIIQLSSQH